MAVFIQRPRKQARSVLIGGVAVSFSHGGFFLYVLDAEGTEITKFREKTYTNYWIETPVLPADVLIEPDPKPKGTLYT
jgi:hypothetical protein